MNKSTGIIIGFAVILVIVGGVYFSNKKGDQAMMLKESVGKDSMESTKNTEEKAMMKQDDTSMTSTDDSMMKAGSYEAYSPEKIAMANDEHNVVLFFRASWCPTCRVVDADIKANLGKMPSDVTILDVNYDNSTALKQKYGVTYQHTFVQVDKNGNLIKKWSGSPTLASLVAEIK